MDDADWNGVPPSNETAIFAVADTPSFDIVFESLASALFWVLLIGHGTLGLVHVIKGNAARLQRWPLYLMMLAYVVFTCICESIALGYTVEANAGNKSTSTWLAYIFFWHASSASFLVLLLALSSGYCITRGTLEGHKAKVLAIPAIVFITGVASDYTFVYVLTTQNLSAAADRYNIVQMTTMESVVWFVGSLANIMCFILAWIYVFDSTQLEIKELDDAQAALTGRAAPNEHSEDEYEDMDEAAARRRRDKAEEDTDDEDTVRTLNQVGPANGQGRSQPRRENGAEGNGAAANGRAQRSLATTSQRVGLLYGMDESTARGAEDEETGQKETVADHMEYTVRKTLLSRFYFGVCGYLFASIMVILLPAFFNSEVQNMIVVAQFVVKFLFTLMLAWIFRPAKDSPYLQVGINESDADDRGVSALDTELTVTEYHQQPNGAPAQSGGGSSSRGGAAGTAPQLPVSTPASALDSVARLKAKYGSGARGDAAQQGQGQGQGQKARFTLDEDE